MTRLTIGLFGPPSDPEILALAERLVHRGAEPWIVDLADIPRSASLTWGTDGIRLEGRNLLDMDAAYLRRTGRRLPDALAYGTAPPSMPEKAWMAYRRQALAALRLEHTAMVVRTALVDTLARQRTVVNPPALQRLHRLKPLLLERLRQAGVPVPASATGTDRDRLTAFATTASLQGAGAGDSRATIHSREVRPTVVTKPLAGIYKTRAFDPENPDAHPWHDRPALLQAFADGDVVRGFVLDGRLLAAARILHRGTVDSSESQTGIATVNLPPKAEQAALRAARAVGARFCGLDLVHGQDETWVIDVNLSPMFVAFSRLSRHDIAADLADYLLQVARPGTGSRQAALDMLKQAKQVLAADPDLVARLAGTRGGRR